MAKGLEATAAPLSGLAEIERSPRAGTMRSLGELRTLCGATQVSLSERLGIGQSEISRVEKRANCRIETLRRYIEEGLGGKLHVIASVHGVDGRRRTVKLL
jgi:hypothetical protein